MMRKSLVFTSVVLALAVLAWGVGPGWAQPPDGNKGPIYKGKVTQAEKKAAAVRAQALGMSPGVAGTAALMNATMPAGIEGPGGVPHYFGPYGNWAYSPLPKGSVTVVTPVDGGAGYTNPVVTVGDAYGTATDNAVVTAVVTDGAVTGFTIIGGGANYSAPVVTIVDNTDLCGGLSQPACGTGATADAVIGGILTGGIRKFVDNVALLTPEGMNNLGQYIPLAVADNVYANSDYYEIALVEYEERFHTDLPPTRLRGYVQLASVNVPGPVGLVAPDGVTPIFMPDNVTQAMAVDNPHYLGPTILGTSNRPVRIKFYNLLPKGPADPVTGRRPGDLFLPVDPTVMGSGIGPEPPYPAEKYTENRAAVHLHGNNTVWISDGTPHQWITPANENTAYPQGVSVRNVPDMDPASVDSPTDGTITIFYTNAMSARLMFYHDHAMGITRLNVYAGEAAGYVLTDEVDKDMYNGTNNTGVNPNLLKVLPGLGIPLVIQDRTFVDSSTIWAQDPTWNWGTGTVMGGNITEAKTGDLWFPHVYMSVQNPWDLAGTNAFGRWHYGPWFNPPVPACVGGLPVGCIEIGPVSNEYHQPDCDLDPPGPGCTAPWEPPLRPGVPNPSIPGEAFQDTPIVNGTAYPVLNVEPKAYRFRVLNAGNDRFLNLQLYVAADKTGPTTAGTDYTATPARLCNGVSGVPVADCTEVKMVPVSVAPANQFADTPSGIPDPATKGPDWWQIGTEGGFLPAPVVIPSQPVGWNLNMAYFNFGVVIQKSLFLGTAERADVVVDFTGYDNQTLILYNDAPAPVPAGAPPYDYYTGSPNQMDAGGAPTTQPGYGPNTRTIMQIRVGSGVTPGTETDNVTLANLNAVFAKGPGTTKRGVFEVSQDPIIIPQAAYNSAYDSTFPANAAAQYVQIADEQKTFKPIQFNPGDNSYSTGGNVTLPLEMKAMHDEMGGVYDTLFGRMSGMLGLTHPTSPVHVLIPYGFASPPTDIHRGSISGTPIGSFPDGTQIWRIFHNGVDTHPIHVHLFNAQLINRLGQDGSLWPPDANELGWKDTFRVNPLEITYIAMRPVVPSQAQVPFSVPNSIRLIDPTFPLGAALVPPPPAGWFDPQGNPISAIFNHEVNFGWEYVWHCHILAHEEMDMMHSLVFGVPPAAPAGLSLSLLANPQRVALAWTDNSANETDFIVRKATSSTGPWSTIYTQPSPTGPDNGALMTYTDAAVAPNTTYHYQVVASNVVGDTWMYPVPSLGFPTMTLDSPPATIFVTTGAAGPAAPINLAATLLATGAGINLAWTDNSSNETSFTVWRSDDGGVFAPIATINRNAGQSNQTGGAVTSVDGNLVTGTTYRYFVTAANAAGTSAPSNEVTMIYSPPAAPTDLRWTATRINQNNYRVTLNWTDHANVPNNETGFTIQRATNQGFTKGLTTFAVGADVTTFTQNVPRTPDFFYRVRANGMAGNSAWSNTVWVITP